MASADKEEKLDDKPPEITRSDVSAVANFATPFDLRNIVNRIGDAKFVLLGECTHGTEEFYKIRADLTKKLIEEKDFHGVIMESEWCPMFRVNRYVHGISKDRSAVEALEDEKEYPCWMWRNGVIVDLIEWIQKANDQAKKQNEDLTNVLGIDCQGIHTPAQAVLDFLKKVDLNLYDEARRIFSIFEPYKQTNMFMYAKDVTAGPLKGQGEAINAKLTALLAKLQRNMQENYSIQVLLRDDMDLEDLLYVEQAMEVCVSAEEYYRKSEEEHAVVTWNLRDQHMVSLILKLQERLSLRNGDSPKMVIWAHNSHVGDARGLTKGGAYQWNLGQMVRQTFGAEKTFILGFSSYKGEVTASDYWSAPHKIYAMNPALPGSYEDLLHQALLHARRYRRGFSADANLMALHFRTLPKEPFPETIASARLESGATYVQLASSKKKEPNSAPRSARRASSKDAAADALKVIRKQRAIGVVYKKNAEESSHFMSCKIIQMYDCLVHVDVTSYLKPMDKFRGQPIGRDQIEKKEDEKENVYLFNDYNVGRNQTARELALSVKEGMFLVRTFDSNNRDKQIVQRNADSPSANKKLLPWIDAALLVTWTGRNAKTGHEEIAAVNLTRKMENPETLANQVSSTVRNKMVKVVHMDSGPMNGFHALGVLHMGNKEEISRTTLRVMHEMPSAMVISGGLKPVVDMCHNDWWKEASKFGDAADRKRQVPARVIYACWGDSCWNRLELHSKLADGGWGVSSFRATDVFQIPGQIVPPKADKLFGMLQSQHRIAAPVVKS